MAIVHRIEAVITYVIGDVTVGPDGKQQFEGQSKKVWEQVGTGPTLKAAYGNLCGNGLTEALTSIADPDA